MINITIPKDRVLFSTEMNTKEFIQALSSYKTFTSVPQDMLVGTHRPKGLSVNIGESSVHFSCYVQRKVTPEMCYMLSIPATTTNPENRDGCVSINLCPKKVLPFFAKAKSETVSLLGVYHEGKEHSGNLSLWAFVDGEYKLMKIDDFYVSSPRTKEDHSSEYSFTLPAKEIQGAITRSLPHIPGGQDQANRNVLRLEFGPQGGRVIATDGNTLHIENVAWLKSQDKQVMYLPINTAKTLEKAIKADGSLDLVIHPVASHEQYPLEEGYRMQYGAHHWVVGKPEGPYPSIDKVIPVMENPHLTISGNAKELLGSVAKCHVTKEKPEHYRYTILACKDGEVSVLNSKALGEDESSYQLQSVESSVGGPKDMMIAVDTHELMDDLKLIKNGEYEIRSYLHEGRLYSLASLHEKGVSDRFTLCIHRSVNPTDREMLIKKAGLSALTQDAVML